MARIICVCQDTKEKVCSRSEYFQTEHWLRLVTRFKKDFCEDCGTGKRPVDLYSFGKWGDETKREIASLCQKCFECREAKRIARKTERKEKAVRAKQFLSTLSFTTEYFGPHRRIPKAELDNNK